MCPNGYMGILLSDGRHGGPWHSRLTPSKDDMALELHATLRMLVAIRSGNVNLNCIRKTLNRSLSAISRAQASLMGNPSWFKDHRGQRRIADSLNLAFEEGDNFLRELPPGTILHNHLLPNRLQIILLSMGISWGEVHRICFHTAMTLKFMRKHESTRNWARFMVIIDHHTEHSPLL